MSNTETLVSEQYGRLHDEDHHYVVGFAMKGLIWEGQSHVTVEGNNLALLDIVHYHL